MRTIETQIRYPAPPGTAGTVPVEGAPVASGYGSFPVIVFAHGYAVTPHTYEPLLDAWVRAGFVVVAPVFPVDNYYEWQAQGGGPAPEADTSNEPADVVYVTRALARLSTEPSYWLHGIANFERLALAGQSDGATVMGALAYGEGDGLRLLLSELPSQPLAVGIFSGQEILGKGLTYAAPVPAPALLAVQSDADYCNPTGDETQLYGAIAPATPSRFFLRTEGADHLGPYDGEAPWFASVAAVSTSFFRLALGVGPGATPPSSSAVVAAGTVPKVSSVSTAPAVVLPATSDEEACGVPSPNP